VEAGDAPSPDVASHRKIVMKSELVPTDGGPPIPIVKDVTVVGRREYCDVEVRHESLSKRHAVIVRTDGLLMIRDLASTNGTKVNGQRVMWAALLPNDRLTLGRCKFKVYLGPDTSPSPSETRGPARPVTPASARRAPEFPPPTPLGVPIPASRVSGSTASDDDPGELDEFLIDDEDPAFVVDLE
jgi:predicted component of type VI protein secretion system